MSTFVASSLAPTQPAGQPAVGVASWGTPSDWSAAAAQPTQQTGGWNSGWTAAPAQPPQAAAPAAAAPAAQSATQPATQPTGGWNSGWTTAPAATAAQSTAPVQPAAATSVQPAEQAPVALAKPERNKRTKGVHQDPTTTTAGAASARPAEQTPAAFARPESVAGSVAPSTASTAPRHRFKSPQQQSGRHLGAVQTHARRRAVYCFHCKTLNDIIQRQCQCDHVHHRVSFEYVDCETGNVCSTNFGNVLPCSLLAKFDNKELTCGTRMPVLCEDGNKCRFLFSAQPCFGVHLARTDDPAEPKLITLVREAPKNIHIKIEWINKTTAAIHKTEERYILREHSAKHVDVYFRGLGPRIPNFEDELIVAFDTSVVGLEQPEGTTHLRITRIKPQ